MNYLTLLAVLVLFWILALLAALALSTILAVQAVIGSPKFQKVVYHYHQGCFIILKENCESTFRLHLFKHSAIPGLYVFAHWEKNLEIRDLVHHIPHHVGQVDLNNVHPVSDVMLCRNTKAAILERLEQLKSDSGFIILPSE